MSYLPLARKYRPQTFEELIGQPHVTTTLTRALGTKRIGQAYLFAGQRGVGKTSAARILAKCLNCTHGPAARPCQRCPSCLAIIQGNSLDVLEIDGASNRGIDEVRSLRETVKFAPTQGAYRIYIIDEVHMLTPEAFNALLKTLEEPPSHVKFIFATTTPQKLPPTILSRCQRFDFRRLDGKTIVSALKQVSKAEDIAIEEAALYAIARASEGSLRDAEVMLEQLVSFCAGRIGEQDVSRLLGAVEQEALFAWAQAVLDRDAKTALLFVTQQLEQGKEVVQLLVGLVTHFRNLLILRTTAGVASRQTLLEQLVDVPAEQLSRLDEQATRCAPEELLVIAQLLTGAYELTRRSPFAQAIVEFVLITLATRESWTSLEQVVQRLERLAHASPSRVTTASVLDPPPAPVTPKAPSSPSAEPTRPTVVPAAQSPQATPGSPQAAVTVASPEAEAVSREEAIERWPTVLERIGRQKMSLAAYLAESRPVGVSGDQIDVGIPGFALHQEVLTLVEHLRLVERVLEEVFVHPLRIHYTTLPAPSPAPPPPAAAQPSAVADAMAAAETSDSSDKPVPPIVQDIVKLFDATIVNSPPPQS